MTEPESSNRRLLIIDDNRAIHADFRKILDPEEADSAALDEAEAALFGGSSKAPAAPRFAMDSAFQGEEGFKMAKEAKEKGRPYAAAFIDVRMPPGWDGVETAARIWEADPDLQVVICTAYSDYSWEEMRERLGASDRLLILKKPFDHVEVQQLANTLTEKWNLLQRSRMKMRELDRLARGRTAELWAANEKLEAEVSQHRRTERELQRAKETAEAAVAARSVFLANMSHEIRTPLNGIIGMNDLLRGTALDAEQREYVEAVTLSGKTLLTLINDILDFSKIEAGKMIFERIKFRLWDVVEQTMALYGDAAEEKNLKLETRAAPGLPELVRGDPTRLRQVITNLVNNAVKFTSGGSVSLSVRLEDETKEKATLRFEVRDTGIGIPEDIQQTLFQSFTQADGSTTRQYGGTGLGLAICKRLVEMMGGQIGMASKPGEGSLFWFTARLGKTGQMTSPPIETSSVSKPPAAAPGGKTLARVLVAEDKPINQDVCRRHLERLGYAVDLAANGKEAVAAWREHSYPFVIMDLQMPEMDGCEAVRQIRALEKERGTNRRSRIIAITAHAMTGAREECLQAGMDDYLAKPITRAALREVMARNTEPPQPPSNPDKGSAGINPRQ